MTDLAKSAKRAGWLRVATWTANAGLLGLFVAAFLPEYHAGTRSIVPAEWLIRPETWYLSADPNAVVAVFGAYLFAPVLLVLCCAGVLVGGERARAAVGWCATLACLVLFFLIAAEIWRIKGPNLPANWWRYSHFPVMVSWLTVTGAATLATALLGFAPAGLRFPGCVGIVGWWTIGNFLLIQALLNPQFSHIYSLSFSRGYVLALASGALIAAGGTVETILLWRHGAPAKETA